MRVPSDFGDRNICIIGLGYVGFTLAITMGDVGFRVFGVERSKELVGSLRQGKAHFWEVGLEESLKAQIAANNISISQQLPARRLPAVYIITVGTPVDESKQTNLKAIENVAAHLARVLKDGDLVVLRSTVRIGVTRNVVTPILDEARVDYDIAYCPERTLEGKALYELRTLPQIVGGLTARATLRAVRLFNFVTPTIIPMSKPEAAELVKLINNTQRDLMFAFSNEVAAMCDAVGASATEVISAGNHGYPRGCLPLPGPVGGPCLEKDPYVLAEGLATIGFTPNLALLARRINEELPKFTIAQLVECYRRMGARREGARKIGLLGLAFKGVPPTGDLRGTMARPIIHELRSQFPRAAIVGFDPVVAHRNVVELGIDPVSTLDQAFADAALVIIQNNHPIFRDMSIEKLATTMERPGIIYDFWDQHGGKLLNLPLRIAYGGLGNLASILEMDLAKTAPQRSAKVA